ncbi:MAG: hypothetical protein DKM50_12365 [Candidatus Margulisiibacteriota bacterium]|nr:MAG: hypothetical protein A2X43_04945 [Candidatus Margulisbacteria bacterium GWD2_39_127]PZM78136.1 MAG: hypothetical protein DKM50_12365 [Candidatus Margulisiibacteriota bacterium]HAR64376.1 hypothetical protein [Candidatus Margulisiibacteriota bacterium]HCY37917.1 hypothetical protein [Candidatus Margulisiibacteriota bacterium]
MGNGIDDEFDQLLDNNADDLSAGSKELEEMSALAKSIKKLPKPEINMLAFAKTVIAVDKIAQKKKNTFSLRLKLPVMLKAASFLLAMFMSASVVGTSAYSLPGSWLYPIKLVTKKIAYVMNTDPSGKAELNISFSEESLKDLRKKFENDQQIDKKVLAAVLAEAQKGLELSNKLAPEKQKQIKEKISRLNEHQIHELMLLQEKLPTSQQQLVADAISCCRQMKDTTQCPYIY